MPKGRKYDVYTMKATFLPALKKNNAIINARLKMSLKGTVINT